MHLDSEGNPTNLTELDIRMENGIFKAEATGAGSVEKVLYNGSETVPVAPGSYPVTCVMKFGEGTIEPVSYTHLVVGSIPAGNIRKSGNDSMSHCRFFFYESKFG